MAIKKSQVEDKSAYAKAPADKSAKSDEKRHDIPEEKEREFNYPEHSITVKAKNKKEADKKLKDLLA